MEICRLDPYSDQAIYEQAYEWLVNSPRWRQETEAAFGTVDHDAYMGNTVSENRISIAVYTDREQLQAIITLMLVAQDTYEAHFEAAPHTPQAVIVEAALSIAFTMFMEYGCKVIYTWVPSFHRTVHKINNAIGFQRDGVNMLRGSCKGRTIDWMRYSLRSPLTEAH